MLPRGERLSAKQSGGKAAKVDGNVGRPDSKRLSRIVRRRNGGRLRILLDPDSSDRDRCCECGEGGAASQREGPRSLPGEPCSTEARPFESEPPSGDVAFRPRVLEPDKGQERSDCLRRGCFVQRHQRRLRGSGGYSASACSSNWKHRGAFAETIVTKGAGFDFGGRIRREPTEDSRGNVSRRFRTEIRMLWARKHFGGRRGHLLEERPTRAVERTETANSAVPAAHRQAR